MHHTHNNNNFHLCWGHIEVIMRWGPPPPTSSLSLIGQPLTGLHEFPQLNTVKLNARTSWRRRETRRLRPNREVIRCLCLTLVHRSAVWSRIRCFLCWWWPLLVPEPATPNTNAVSQHTPAFQRSCSSGYCRLDLRASGWLGFSGIQFFS